MLFQTETSTKLTRSYKISDLNYGYKKYHSTTASFAMKKTSNLAQTVPNDTVKPCDRQTDRQMDRLTDRHCAHQ